MSGPAIHHLPARHLTRRSLCAGLLGGALLVACGSSNRNTPLDLEPPSEHTTLGPGDIFNLEIVGEKDLPTEYQVASDGTVTVPYIHGVEVAGLEPQEVATLVRERLMERKILTDPSVVVTVKEYRSKRVTLLGQVQKPGSFPLAPGMTLLQAISLAGGMTSIAQASRVNLTRKTKNGTRTVVVNVEEIYEGRASDIPLQAGDSVYVRERIF